MECVLTLLTSLLAKSNASKYCTSAKQNLKIYRFSRYGPALNPGMDFDLNSDLYVIYGLRTTGESEKVTVQVIIIVHYHTDNNGASNLLDHTSAPIRTSAVVNPFTATGTLQSAAYPEKALLQVHGQSSIYTAMHALLSG